MKLEPFRMYLNDATKTQKIEHEEIIELSRRYRNGDEEALKEIIEANLKLVISFAKPYRCSLPMEDLISAGNIGLVTAAMKFDPEKGIKFSTYAHYWILNYIFIELKKEKNQIKWGTTPRITILMKELIKFEKEFKTKKGRPITIAELSQKLGISIEETEKLKLIKKAIVPISLQTPIDSKQDIESITQCQEPDPEAENILLSSRRLVIQTMNEITLNEREDLIVNNRLKHGEEWEKGLTLQQIADKFGVTREAIRQQEESLKKRLKRVFKEKGVTPEIFLT